MKHPKTYSLPACPLSSSSRSPSPTPSSTSKSANGLVHYSPSGAKLFAPPRAVDFVELLARSNFSFLQGASHPDEMVKAAKNLGYRGVGLCDVNGLYGIVRGFQAIDRPSSFDTDQIFDLDESLNEPPHAPFRYLCGTELTPYDASPVALMPINKQGYVALCHLLTAAKRRAPKGHLVLSLKHILAANQNLLAFPLPPWKREDLERLHEAFQERLFLPVHRDFTWDSIRLYQQALQFEKDLGLALFATQRPLYHHASRQPLHDVLTCILHKTTLEAAATRLAPNGERHLKTLPEIAALFRERPDLLERTNEIAALVEFSLSELKYKYPQAHLPDGMNATEHLRFQVEKGLLWRYPQDGTSAEHLTKARQLVEKELEVIRQLEYEDYFLTLWDICQFARERGILHQGRGSAANSIVCYTLGLTAADPVKLGFMFERFISTRRREPPDIDVDFEHARREEVIQYIYKKYGERHAAMVCTVISYRSRMAIREVAKVFGVANDQIDALTKYMGREGLERLAEVAGWSGAPDEGEPLASANAHRSSSGGLPVGGGMPAGLFARAIDSFAETKPWLTIGNPELEPFGLNRKRFGLLVRLAHELLGFPRHLGIHSGGFVISHDPVIDIVPVEAATKDARFVVQWNKDDVNTLGLMKLDILSLGMLTAIQKSFTLLEKHKGIDLNLATVPQDDKPTYEMIQKAETVGVFQIESRAQMSLLPRLKPACYYDLVIEVAIVRPGPIQGGMVHPFLRRRSGVEKVVYAHPCLEPILKKTMGIPLFQEQVMQIAVEAAGFSPEESDDLRRIMSSAWRKKAVMGNIHQRVVSGMLSRGISRDYAEQIYKTIEGFSSYGFPESHAASFALITYVSCYLKKHHPDVFACSLLNSQPMGFYSPRQLVSDAQRNGVHFYPLDVQHSDWDYTLEAPPPLASATRINSAGLRIQSVGGSVGQKIPASNNSYHAVRVGICSIYGVREEQAKAIVSERKKNGAYHDITDLVRRSQVPRAALLRLASAGALASFGLNARQALWAIQGMSFDAQSLFFGAPVALDHARLESEVDTLPVENPWENVRREYGTKGFAVDSHPLAVLRPLLLRSRRPYTTALRLKSLRHRTPLRVAGLMSLLQKPPTAKGMCFISLEDETGLMNIVITPDVYQQVRLVLLQSPMLEVEGFLESREGVINVRAQRIRPLKQSDLVEA